MDWTHKNLSECIDAAKAEVRELDNLGFMESVSASLTNLLSLPSKEIKCVESIVFSSFNPPPGYRRFSSFLGNFTCYIALSNVMKLMFPWLRFRLRIALMHWIPFCCIRLSGDLIYLDVLTLEGNKYCVTGTTKGFYVNSSSGNILDPRPSKTASEATTLIGLLQKISPKFKKGNNDVVRSNELKCFWALNI